MLDTWNPLSSLSKYLSQMYILYAAAVPLSTSDNNILCKVGYRKLEDEEIEPVINYLEKNIKLLAEAYEASRWGAHITNPGDLKVIVPPLGKAHWGPHIKNSCSSRAGPLFPPVMYITLCNCFMEASVVVLIMSHSTCVYQIM